ncbi:MAG: 1-acyl-sn-glycerol-3-phosphate acyltransferase [Clostridia bacterium]|nr:1-acyl-sn-glycerol-3-phosphate acyltransferase [Clostridia bacterium]
MLELICAIIGAGLTALTAVLNGYSGWSILLIIPIFLGYMIALIALVFIFAYVASLPEDISKTREKPNKLFRVLFNLINGIVCDFGGARLKVTGTEKLDKKKRYLFVMNHRSNFDPMVVAKKFKKYNLILLSKPENFKIPLAGKGIHMAGFLSVDRNCDREASKAILKAVDYLKSGYSIGVCPEGTRNKKGLDLLPFHSGTFKIALKANAPIAVLSVNGCENIHRNFPFKRTIVHIDVVDVIEPERYEGLSTSQISEVAATAIQKNIDGYKEGAV